MIDDIFKLTEKEGMANSDGVNNMRCPDCKMEMDMLPYNYQNKIYKCPRCKVEIQEEDDES